MLFFFVTVTKLLRNCYETARNVVADLKNFATSSLNLVTN